MSWGREDITYVNNWPDINGSNNIITYYGSCKYCGVQVPLGTTWMYVCPFNNGLCVLETDEPKTCKCCCCKC